MEIVRGDLIYLLLVLRPLHAVPVHGYILSPLEVSPFGPQSRFADRYGVNLSIEAGLQPSKGSSRSQSLFHLAREAVHGASPVSRRGPGGVAAVDLLFPGVALIIAAAVAPSRVLFFFLIFSCLSYPSISSAPIGVRVLSLHHGEIEDRRSGEHTINITLLLRLRDTSSRGLFCHVWQKILPCMAAGMAAGGTG